jgi:hypothetical protein
MVMFTEDMLFEEGLRNEALGLHEIDDVTAATLLRHAEELFTPMDAATTDAIFGRQLKELGWSFDHWKTIVRAQVAKKVVKLRLAKQDKPAPAVNVILGPDSWWT